jgi:hypothetical protein
VTPDRERGRQVREERERERERLGTCTSCALTSRCSARRNLNLDESKLVPDPMTRLAGKPDSFQAT